MKASLLLISLSDFQEKYKNTFYFSEKTNALIHIISG